MRHSLILVVCFFFSHLVQSQDSIGDVIEKVFYQEKLFKIIFFDYHEMSDTPFPLPEAKLAFIIPDTTFQKLYPDILSDMASGWGKEGMMHTKTFIKRPEGSVLVNNGFYMNPSMRLLVRIVGVGITNNKAFLEFNTTSQFLHDDMKGRYVWVKAHLKKKRGQWKISDLSISDYPWRGYMFPDDELFDEHRDKNPRKIDH